MKVHASDMIPMGKCALIRDGDLVWMGAITKLSAMHKPGDILCVNTEAYFALQAAVGKQQDGRT